MLCRVLGGVLAFVFGVLLAASQAQAAKLSQTQVLLEGEQSSVILDFDGPFQTPKIFALDGPRRIVVDLPGIDARTGPTGAAGGLVSATRIGQPVPGTARLVIDLSQPAVVADARTSDPISSTSGYRLILRLAPASEADFAKQLGSGKIKSPQLATAPVAKPAPAPSPVPTPVPAPDPPQAVPGPAAPGPASIPTPGPVYAETTKPQPITVPLPKPPVANPIRGRVPVVVIDAGHGGRDPGAPSVLKGRYEKEVALSVALGLRSELIKTGRFRVVMTRETDVFIPFRERLDIARRANADLFISIHADSISDKSVRGATIYTLSDGRADKEAERLAAAENKADFVGGGINVGGERDDVVDILFSLVQRETRNYSAEFAEYVAREMSRFVLMRPKYHRQASLIVLTSPDIPSVLIETGYMSNEADSLMLFTKEGQQNIARAIRQAIEIYFDRRVGK